MRQLIVGIFGFDFNSYNKGCEALTYSFVALLDKYKKNNSIIICNFTYNDDLGKVPESFPNIQFERIRLHLKSPKAILNCFKIMKKCDLFFDATFGDGFSDIYGKKWNIKTDFIKQMVIWSKTPLILLPQTYGPFENKFLKSWAISLIKKACLVYSRDDLSTKYIYEECGLIINTVSDMAFKLPYIKTKKVEGDHKIKIGINVSSLLWEGEWAEKNSNIFKVNYRKYIYELIDELIENNYDVFLIPHVINKKQPDFPENDYRICLELKKKYLNRIEYAPPFDTPIDAKNYISRMDVFIGARMHSTIASLSTGVATIPFSYSRKFEGLFGNIDYPFVICANSLETNEALEKTLLWIRNYEQLKAQGKVSLESAMKALEKFEIDIDGILNGIK